jgi:hypothetical protein
VGEWVSGWMGEWVDGYVGGWMGWVGGWVVGRPLLQKLKLSQAPLTKTGKCQADCSKLLIETV